MINVGIVFPNPRIISTYDFNKCIDFIVKYIESNNERILKIRRMAAMKEFEILTDKAKYKSYIMSENIRGCRWNKVFTYGYIDPNIMKRICSQIRPIGLVTDEGWNPMDQVFKI